ncbi:MAG: tRNA threonylcarbamoyladenosine dehydratase, partial [Clostridia bacterium]
VRSGVGKIALVDNDVVALSNINRQIIALHSTIGRYKVDVMKERIVDINPNCEVEVFKVFYLPSNADDFHLENYDYVVDAIDTVSAKLQLVVAAKKAGVKIVSSMGAGNKICPTMFKVEDIFKTKECPLCRVMRKELKARGVENLKVVYSEETPIVAIETSESQNDRQCHKECQDDKNCGDDCIVEQSHEQSRRKQAIASIAFTPSVVGLIIASEVVNDLIK